MSIDTIWVIARLFDVRLDELLQKNLRETDTNIEIVNQFLQKVRKQTDSHAVEWFNGGGLIAALDPRIRSLGIFIENGADEDTEYRPTDNHINPEIKWVLKNDIYYTKDIVPGKIFVIVNFRNIPGEYLKNQLDEVDAILITYDETKDTYSWEKVFYASDDKFGTVCDEAQRLVASIIDQEFDTVLPKNIRTFMSNYLKEEN